MPHLEVTTKIGWKPKQGVSMLELEYQDAWKKDG